MNTNELTQQILKGIEKEKVEAYAPLVQHLKGLLEDGKKCLQELQKAFHFNESITSAILALTFSPYFQKRKQDVEALSGQQASSVLGKWDELMRWAEWTKMAFHRLTMNSESWN